MPERFVDAIKALRHIARGNGAVMRIADRIVAAHERELAAAKLAAEMPTYDVEGNERHKAACELRDMKIGKLSTHWDFVCSLAARLNIPRPNDEPYEDYELHELIRDKLVNLLGGECNFSTPESYMACEDGDPNPAETSPDEQTSVTLGTHLPITGELRAAMHQWGWVESDGSITFFTSSSMPPSIDAKKSLAIIDSDFDRYCDAIDAVHAQLERENEELRVKFVNANRHALHVEQNYADAISALDLALREHDNYVQLPVDANNEVIHLGDDIETLDEQHKGEHCAVEYMALTYDGWEVDGEPPLTLIHHRPDTWESIIYDAMQVGRTDATVDVTPLIERCKALAGEDR